jgi:protein TonB
MRLREQEQSRTAEEVLECPSLQQTLAPANLLASADLSNVIFLRRQQPVQVDAPPCIVDLESRPVPLPPRLSQRSYFALCAFAVLAHGAVLGTFLMYRPQPLASIGVEAVSVELVLGSNSLAGDTDPNSQASFNSSYTPPKDKLADKPTPDESQQAPVKPFEIAAVESAPHVVEEPPQKPDVTAPEMPKDVKPETAVTIAPDMPLTTPERPKPVETKPVEVKPVEIKRDTPKPVVKKPEVKQAATRKKSDDAKKNTQIAAAPPAADNSVAAKGAGIGQSSATSNYKGIVHSHIMRFQQAPRDTANQGQRGNASVRFWYDASGRITSKTLLRNSGFAAIDSAAMDMVQRASPIPAPPPEFRGKYFDLPVNFVIR